MLPDADAGSSYGQLISDQLARERSHKTNLEARGITVVTTSGTLTTLLFALTAGLTTVAKFKLLGSAKLPLLLALISFVVAAALGLVTNMPLKYQEPTPRGLAHLVNANYWTGPKEIGQLRVAAAQVTTLSAARSANNLKVILLLGAILSELLAVIFLSWAIITILYST